MKLSRAALVANFFLWSVAAASAETVAIVAVCSKTERVCNQDTARSVYRIPVQGTICFVPIQQRLAEMGVYDEKQDDIRITCESKSAG